MHIIKCYLYVKFLFSLHFGNESGKPRAFKQPSNHLEMSGFLVANQILVIFGYWLPANLFDYLLKLNGCY